MSPDDIALRDAVIWDAIVDANGTNHACAAVISYLEEAGFSIVRTTEVEPPNQWG